MTETMVLTIRMPEDLFDEMEENTGGRYLGKGEFVRAALMRLLAELGFVKPFSARMRENREKLRARLGGRELDPEEEIRELKKIRGGIWGKEYESGFR